MVQIASMPRSVALAEETPCYFGITARRESKIDQLSVLINSTLKITPLSTNTNIRLVHVPIQAAP
jgi:hypothetical protein